MGNKIIRLLLTLGTRIIGGCGASVILTVMALILCPGPGFAAGRDLSFDQALDMMTQNNEAIKAANMEKSAREKERAAAKGLYFPTISASGKYTRIDDPLVMDLNPIRDVMYMLHSAPLPPGLPPGSLPDFAMTAQEDEFIKGRILATWPVFTGGVSRRSMMRPLPGLKRPGKKSNRQNPFSPATW